MMTNVVEQLRDLAARNSAIRQYRHAARLHSEAAAALNGDGWDEAAGLDVRLAELTGAAALLEKLDPEPSGLHFFDLDVPR